MKAGCWELRAGGFVCSCSRTCNVDRVRLATHVTTNEREAARVGDLEDAVTKLDDAAAALQKAVREGTVLDTALNELDKAAAALKKAADEQAGRTDAAALKAEIGLFREEVLDVRVRVKALIERLAVT
jgi:hypothetical protein